MTKPVQHLCQQPGCAELKLPGRGSRYCQQHTYRPQPMACHMPGCPEPKLFGQGYRYCAKHSAEGPKRENAQLVRRARERKYGITHDEYVTLLDAQGGVCAICGNNESGRDPRQMSVDHDHKTGAIRGLLCNRCNPMLGYARDDIGVLQAAIAYLTQA